MQHYYIAFDARQPVRSRIRRAAWPPSRAAWKTQR